MIAIPDQHAADFGNEIIHPSGHDERNPHAVVTGDRDDAHDETMQHQSAIAGLVTAQTHGDAKRRNDQKKRGNGKGENPHDRQGKSRDGSEPDTENHGRGHAIMKKWRSVFPAHAGMHQGVESERRGYPFHAMFWQAYACQPQMRNFFAQRIRKESRAAGFHGNGEMQTRGRRRFGVISINRAFCDPCRGRISSCLKPGVFASLDPGLISAIPFRDLLGIRWGSAPS